MEAPVQPPKEAKRAVSLHEIDPQQISESLKDWKFSESGSAGFNNREWQFKLTGAIEQIELQVREEIDPRIEEQSHFEIDILIPNAKGSRMEELRGIRVGKVVCGPDKVSFSRGDIFEKEYTKVHLSNDGHIHLSIGGRALGEFRFQREPPKKDRSMESLQRAIERAKRLQAR